MLTEKKTTQKKPQRSRFFSILVFSCLFFCSFSQAQLLDFFFVCAHFPESLKKSTNSLSSFFFFFLFCCVTLHWLFFHLLILSFFSLLSFFSYSQLRAIKLSVKKLKTPNTTLRWIVFLFTKTLLCTGLTLPKIDGKRLMWHIAFLLRVMVVKKTIILCTSPLQGSALCLTTQLWIFQLTSHNFIEVHHVVLTTKLRVPVIFLVFFLPVLLIV